MTKTSVAMAFIGLCAMAFLPACAGRSGLTEDSGRSVRGVFHVQAKKRQTMKVAPLNADEAKSILERYQSAGKKGRGKTSRSKASTGSNYPTASGKGSQIRRRLD